jgi:hypothetical protein
MSNAEMPNPLKMSNSSDLISLRFLWYKCMRDVSVPKYRILLKMSNSYNPSWQTPEGIRYPHRGCMIANIRLGKVRVPRGIIFV